ncbi:GNAT family N-acetyltransferase [Streptomyces sp. Tu 2975]|uniref:GNAT family N-acetyltransferase n=1 Tax=Streptomyces sp. Tu 2975 TaxID=2676871 RepID=UPI001356D9C6|nr:GNAT family N-acetyltransferase [Streptomyces sp. Tu 2975]QIP84828.1 GNAT family N-acetyltransferase [Streptomyces sp. Tu 2975]
MPLTVRPATLADAPFICALLNAVDIVEIGRADTELHTVETDLAHPEVDLAQDSWLVHEDGDLVAYGILWSDSGDGDIGVDHYVLPGRPDAAVLVLERIEERAAAKAAAAGAARAVLHLNLNVRPTLDTGLLGARGWRVVRCYQVMTRPLSEADRTPELPAGVSLRDCVADADHRIAHALVEETFAEHFDHHPRTYEQWLADTGPRDRSLMWIASLEGEGDVAVLLTRDDKDAMGWIGNLGVRKQARGRGLGGHLLRHAFGTYAARGRDTIGLAVDTQNESRALSLYEAHGMSLFYAIDTWELVLTVHPAAGRVC